MKARKYTCQTWAVTEMSSTTVKQIHQLWPAFFFSLILTPSFTLSLQGCLLLRGTADWEVNHKIHSYIISFYVYCLFTCTYILYFWHQCFLHVFYRMTVKTIHSKNGKTGKWRKIMRLLKKRERELGKVVYLTSCEINVILISRAYLPSLP